MSSKIRRKRRSKLLWKLISRRNCLSWSNKRKLWQISGKLRKSWMISMKMRRIRRWYRQKRESRRGGRRKRMSWRGKSKKSLMKLRNQQQSERRGCLKWRRPQRLSKNSRSEIRLCPQPLIRTDKSNFQTLSKD